MSNSAGVVIFGGVLEQNGKGIQASSKRGLKAKPPLKLSTKVIDLEVQRHFSIFIEFCIFSVNMCRRMNLTALAAQCELVVLIYSAGHSMSPLLMSSMISWGARPSTVHPTDWAVPRISFMTPDNSFDLDLGLMILAALMMSSIEMLPLCLMFLT